MAVVKTQLGSIGQCSIFLLWDGTTRSIIGIEQTNSKRLPVSVRFAKELRRDSWLLPGGVKSTVNFTAEQKTFFGPVVRHPRARPNLGPTDWPDHSISIELNGET